MIGATGTPDKVDLDAQCFVCGCTDDVACPGGCWWAEDPEAEMLDVCTACVELRDRLAAAGRPVSLQQLADRSGDERDDVLAWLEDLPSTVTKPGEPAAPDWLGGLHG